MKDDLKTFAELLAERRAGYSGAADGYGQLIQAVLACPALAKNHHELELNYMAFWGEATATFGKTPDAIHEAAIIVAGDLRRRFRLKLFRWPKPPQPPTAPAGPRETWRFTVESLPGDSVPPIIRIRKLLKMALRAYRLRATAVECLPATASPATDPTGGSRPKAHEARKQRLMKPKKRKMTTFVLLETKT